MSSKIPSFPTDRTKIAVDELHRQRLAVLDGRPSGTLLVHEIYASIQGESTFAGLPCTFVRLSGCQLRCHWCDTPHAFREGQLFSIEQVLDAVSALKPRLVELTGGEPLAQEEAVPLLANLADRGYRVLLETAGVMPIDAVDPRVTVILDIKCPGSGEVNANYWPNLDRLKSFDEVKFVIADRADFEWAVEVVRRFDLCKRPVHFAPVFGELEYGTLCRWILATELPIRFQMQQHKHIWDPNAKGV